MAEQGQQPGGATRTVSEELLTKVIDHTRKQCSQLLAAPGPHLCCPIAHELLVDPVIASDGHTYERSFILRHFHMRPPISPMTNQRLRDSSVVPNFFAKAAVQEYKDEAVRTAFDMVRAALDIFPITAELGDLETAEKLLERAKEYGGDAAEICTMQCMIWSAMLPAVGRKGEIDIAVDKLPRLYHINARAAESAISDLDSQFLADLLEKCPADMDPMAKLLLAHERVRRQMDHVVTQIRELDQSQLAAVPTRAWKGIADTLCVAGRDLAAVDLAPEVEELEFDLFG